ncbi:MAG: hypothetical protein V4594_19975 [Bacteroidota bacterium]
MKSIVSVNLSQQRHLLEIDREKEKKEVSNEKAVKGKKTKKIRRKTR